MALNFSTFTDWLQTRQITLSATEIKVFNLLLIQNFQHHLPTRTFTIILNNSRLVPFPVLNSLRTKISASDLQKIIWIYNQMSLQTEDTTSLRDYFDHFFQKYQLNQIAYQLHWKSQDTIILISDEYLAFELYRSELLIFLENWGIALKEIIITNKISNVNTSFLQKSPVQQVISQDKKELLSPPDLPSEKPSFDSLSEVSTSSISKSTLKNIIPTKVPLNKKNYGNAHFVVSGKVLTVDSNTFNNVVNLKVLIDQGKSAMILETFVKYEDVQILNPIRPNHWFKFECFRTFKDKKKLFFDSFTPQDAQFTRLDDAPEKRIELQTHTKMSALDGVTSAEAYLETAAKWGHSAIAFTDHENIHIFPELNNLIDKYPHQKIIFGCEFNTIETGLYVLNKPISTLLEDQKMVFIDLETTGLSLIYDEIIEFAAVTVRKGLKIDEESFLISAKKPISPEITELTGISKEEHAKRQIPLSEALPRIERILEGAVIVAHNSRFDMGFLHEVFRRHKKTPLQNAVIDTLHFAYITLKETKTYRLGRVARSLGIYYDRKRAHRALYDAQILSEIYPMLIQNAKIKTFTELHKLNQHINLKQKTHSKRINVLVKNNQGLQNLYFLVSKSHTDMLYRKPVLEKEFLNKSREGLLVGSAGSDGEIFETAYMNSDAELKAKMQFYDYIQIQPPEVYHHLTQRGVISSVNIKDILRRIIQTARELNLPVVATGDVYFLNPEDSFYRDIYIFNKQLKGKPHRLFDVKNRVSGSPPQYFRTTAEMLKAFAFLDDASLIQEIVITNPQKIAAQIEKIRCFSQELSMPHLTNAESDLKGLAEKSLQKKYGTNLNPKVKKRFEDELNQVIQQGYATIYLIAQRLTQFSFQNNYLIGSRGSVGSSFLAFCLEITEVNPLDPHYFCLSCGYFVWVDLSKYHSGFDLPLSNCSTCQKELKRDGHSIPFESFLGLDAKTVPDIDLNFSGEFQESAQKFVIAWLEKELGAHKIFRAGTISTVAGKTAYGYYRNYMEIKNLPEQEYAEVQKIIANIKGVKRTTGQHPGGLMILPKERNIFEFTPYNYPSNNKNETNFTTHFDYHALNNQLLKIDILGHDDPTALRMLEQMTGYDPKTIPLAEPGIIQTFSHQGAVALPEFGTEFVRGILQKVPVKTFADLISVSGLSHGTNVWESNAKNLLESHKDFGFQDVIACRDDIMNFLIKWNIDKVSAYNYMQHVKKGRGFNKEEINHLLQHGVKKWFIESCSKIRYLFPKAHATAYVIMSYRLAWYKVHFPAEFYATFFSIRCEVFDLLTITQGVAAIRAAESEIQRKIKINPREVSTKEKHLLGIYEVSREMWGRKVQIQSLHLEHSQDKHFVVREENGHKVIYPPFNAVDQLGAENATKIIEARQQKAFTSQEDFRTRTKINHALFDNLQKTGVFAKIPVSSQAQFNFE